MACGASGNPWGPALRAGVKDEQKHTLLARAVEYTHAASGDLEPARQQILQAPKIIKKPKELHGPEGDLREDNYYWLRDDDRQDPEVLEHLKVSFATGGLRKCLFQYVFGWLLTHR